MKDMLGNLILDIDYTLELIRWSWLETTPIITYITLC